MIIGVPREIKDHETRVGLVPSGVTALREAGHEVLVETHAGEGSSHHRPRVHAGRRAHRRECRRGVEQSRPRRQSQRAAAGRVSVLPARA